MKMVLRGIVVLSALCYSCSGPGIKSESLTAEPKIVNIINFVRLVEPRNLEYTEDVLFNTTLEQVRVMRKYRLSGTFLLQYDALMDSRYQELMNRLPADSFEIGAWWEITQPHVEKAGMKWRGRFPWDWHADVGFSTGYTPEEREKLVDVYMNDFKKIFGRYPASVGSWFIDAHTLNYLYDKYGITASCNCKDQYGTDGYTLWGGYWNQAYYPSRLNSYMPAQTVEKQLPVPVFRMLGSDPVRQYDIGIYPNGQGCISLEPIYNPGGKDSAWVHWFFREYVNGESMEFNYVQAGQENSFTWNKISKGFMLQMPLIARLRDESKIRVETLEKSGRWFREKFKVTPATSFTVSRDIEGSDKKTVWFNSRYYRINLLWEDGTLRIRDIHKFDEDFPSFYTRGVATSNSCEFYTLPVFDGFLWSSREETAQMRFMTVMNGEKIALKGADPVFSKSVPGQLEISWPLLDNKGTFVIKLDEGTIRINLEDSDAVTWHIETNVSENAVLPFMNIKSSGLECSFSNMKYFIKAEKGLFSGLSDEGFRIDPDENSIVINLSE